MRSIDLNCDMGEGDVAMDLALLEVVSTANVACGGHAGDEQSMRETAAAAMARGVKIMAHPGYVDRAGFGRVEKAMPAVEIEKMVADQVRALSIIVERLGGEVLGVKPHGALYHAAMNKREVADAVAAGVARVRSSLVLVGQAGAAGLSWWGERGMPVAREAFADRRYEPDGSLRSRSKPGALIEEPEAAARQALRISQGLGVVATDGSTLAVDAQTICVHGDTEGAPKIARAVCAALQAHSIAVRAIKGDPDR